MYISNVVKMPYYPTIDSVQLKGQIIGWNNHHIYQKLIYDYEYEYA